MKLGRTAMEALRAEVSGRLLPGDDLVVAGEAALSGTVRLIEEHRAYLEQFFSSGFLADAADLCRNCGIPGCVEESSIWRLAEDVGAHARFALAEGGFLSALWKMAEASQVGLRADLRRVPVRQETIEICERLNLDPYRLVSQGSFLAGLPKGEDLVRVCQECGLTAAVIGRTDASNDRLLYSGGNARYLERPRPKNV